jgi:4'-phosphopantetheinyl transferase
VGEERIVEKHFSPSEVARFKSLPGELQREAFLNGWTRKEACMKARGEGLSMPLDTFEVSLAPGKPARLMSVNGNSGEASRWTLLEIHPGVGYVGAVATDQNPVKPVFWQWKP